MHVHALRCFGATANTGNPALVIEDDQSNPDARQAFAREHNTTCVWIDPPQEDGTAAIVDFYYPHTRSPLCLHATLAAAARLFARPGANLPLTVKTAMHGQPLALTREGEHLFVRLSPQPAPQPALTPELPARLLGIPTTAIVAAPQVASIGSPKLLVQVRAPATLHALTPHLEAITQWARKRASMAYTPTQATRMHRSSKAATSTTSTHGSKTAPPASRLAPSPSCSAMH